MRMTTVTEVSVLCASGKIMPGTLDFPLFVFSIALMISSWMIWPLNSPPGILALWWTVIHWLVYQSSSLKCSRHLSSCSMSFLSAVSSAWVDVPVVSFALVSIAVFFWYFIYSTPYRVLHKEHYIKSIIYPIQELSLKYTKAKVRTVGFNCYIIVAYIVP